MKTYKAKIKWLSPELGGREHIPTGPRYSTIVRFEDDKADWLKEAWSAIIEFNTSPDESRCLLGDFRFLVEEAPTQFLYKGSQFKLYEGSKAVAVGEILEIE